ncbi:Fc.00g065230.m01.CDS01 [Cosmosporella sp. VM-42]
MPFVSEDAHPGRKRRWSDDDERGMYALYATDEPKDFYVLNQRQELTPRKIMPLTAKRARITDDDLHIHEHSPSPPSHRRRRSSQLRHLQAQPAIAVRQPQKPSSALLTPCHICHRKPTKKSDLDSFAECQGCGERTCYVCIRACHGWNLSEGGSVLSEQEVLSRSFNMDDMDDMQEQDKSGNNAKTGDGTRKGWDAGGHRAVVCSRCCIERGAEGDVACLGCLSRMEGA